MAMPTPQESQGLTTAFSGFPALVAALAERCDRAPGAFFAVLLLSACGERARLDFVQVRGALSTLGALGNAGGVPGTGWQRRAGRVRASGTPTAIADRPEQTLDPSSSSHPHPHPHPQDMSFKFIDLCSLAFTACADRVVRRAAAARYDAARARADAAQAQLDALSAAVKQRNPGLLVQFKTRWGAPPQQQAAAGACGGVGAAAVAGGLLVAPASPERAPSPFARGLSPAGAGKRGAAAVGGVGGAFGELGAAPGLLSEAAESPRGAGARRGRGAGRGAAAGPGISAHFW